PAHARAGYVCDYIVELDTQFYSNEGTADGQRHAEAVQTLFGWLQNAHSQPGPQTSSGRFLYVPSRKRWMKMSDRMGEAHCFGQPRNGGMKRWPPYGHQRWNSHLSPARHSIGRRHTTDPHALPYSTGRLSCMRRKHPASPGLQPQCCIVSPKY